jgi:hypothetical protein
MCQGIPEPELRDVLRWASKSHGFHNIVGKYEGVDHEPYSLR